MPLVTTVIGSFPKPDYVDVPDWFTSGNTGATMDQATQGYTKLLAAQSSEDKEKFEETILLATTEVLSVQQECGLNIVTDGEVRRENYIHYLCRFIEGIDFDQLTETSLRNGAMTARLPTIRGKLSWRGPLDVGGEWRKSQDLAAVPVKYTLPGPMTIMGTVFDAYYKDEERLAADLAVILNSLVKELEHAGCRYIQIDEPLFARKPDQALSFGIKMLDRCFEGVGKECQKEMHMCCGYPNYLDEENYLKADPSVYKKLAAALDNSSVDAVSIEDAHCYNDLSLLECFRQKKVIFGAIQIAKSRVETCEEIEDRLNAALSYIDEERLIVAPDCGLAHLPMPILKQKLTNMCAAARKCGCKRPRMV